MIGEIRLRCLDDGGTITVRRRRPGGRAHSAEQENR